MSVGIDKTSDSDHHSTAGETIIDAEVVHEEPPTGAAGSNKARMNSDDTMKTIPAPESKPNSKAGWVAAGLLGVFIGGVFAAPYFQSGLAYVGIKPVTPSAIAPAQEIDLSPLQTSISDMKALLDRHQAILAQQASRDAVQNETMAQIRADIALLASSEPGAALSANTPAEFAALKAEMVRLTDDLARISALNAEADPAVSQLTGALALARAEGAQLRARLNALETSLQGIQAGALEATPRGRLVLLLSRMKDRAFEGLSFAADLEGLRVDLAELPALDQQLMGAEIAVLSASGTGIRTYASLVRDYDAAVAAALREGEKESGTFFTRMFTSRRTDAGATGNDAIFLKAERRLSARDMAGAVLALSELEGATAETISPWRKDAEAYVAVDRAFDRLIKAAANAGPPRAAPSAVSPPVEQPANAGDAP